MSACSTNLQVLGQFWSQSTSADALQITRSQPVSRLASEAAKAAAGGLNRLDEVVRSAQLKKLSLNFFFALDYALFI